MVKSQPSEANQATLHYNYARAAIFMSQHMLALEQCEAALKLKSDYHQVLYIRTTSQIII